jgi:hypothetical protein
MAEEVSGLAPEGWEARLRLAADRPAKLAAVLADLEQEMRQEKNWLHDNPEPSNLVASVLAFFGKGDRDVERLAAAIQDELRAERYLKERYRAWLPGEDHLDVLFPYLKGFGERVSSDATGLQFPGFGKYEGVRRGRRDSESWLFYISDRFPGRDPANFHVWFVHATGELLVKRAYKKELPRIEGISTVGRAVLAEMIRGLVRDLRHIRQLEVDNAANQATRDALVVSGAGGDGAEYGLRQGVDAARTPLGHLMLALAAELGLRAHLPFRLFLGSFGTLRMELSVGS